MMERYIPIRPGISDHLLRGDISLFEFGVYVTIHLQADFRTGIWRGSAPRLLNTAPRGAKLREIQRALEHLTDLGLLKHFHEHGQRGNFPFLINKFTVRSGALTGMRLNADKSESWQSPVYESCADDDADVRAQDAPIQEVRSNKQEERGKKPAAKPTRPADSRFQPFFSFAYESFTQKHGAKPNWNGRHPKALQCLLNANREITGEELQRRWDNYLASTDPFILKQGGSLAYFCSSIDSYASGPVLERIPHKEGLSHAEQRSRRNAQILGYPVQ